MYGTTIACSVERIEKKLRVKRQEENTESRRQNAEDQGTRIIAGGDRDSREPENREDLNIEY